MQLKYQSQLISSIRNFFLQQGFLDIIAPPVVPHPGIDVHIHHFEVVGSKVLKDQKLYLHTSPEFYMKQALSHGLDNIFSIGHSFRDEPESPIHRPQFLMLEWYRTNVHYHKIIQDLEDLSNHLLSFASSIGLPPKFQDKVKVLRKTVGELFDELLKLDIHKYQDKGDLYQLIQKDHPDIALPLLNEKLSIDDLFFLLFLNKIEPHLDKYDFLIVDEYPHYLSALSTLHPENPLVCQRFELFIKGVEIANCYNELVDPIEQEKRVHAALTEKKSLYGHDLPYPEVLMKALKKGIPQSSGVALGVERFLFQLFDLKIIFA